LQPSQPGFGQQEQGQVIPDQEQQQSFEEEVRRDFGEQEEGQQEQQGQVVVPDQQQQEQIQDFNQEQSENTGFGQQTDETGGGGGFCEGTDDGYYRHPTDCHRFVQCFASQTFVLECAPGLVFNPREEAMTCDWPRNVPECEVPQTRPEEGDVDADCQFVTDGTFFRDAADCSMFYRCIHGVRIDFACAETTVFNIRLSVCDYPSNVPECSQGQGDFPFQDLDQKQQG
jgi:hypothetical protein